MSLTSQVNLLATRIASEIKPLNISSTSEFLFTGGGECTISRSFVSGAGGAIMASGFVHFNYFTAKSTEAITQLRSLAATATSGTAPTLCRSGIYSEDVSGNLTLIASISNDTTLWSSNSAYATRTLNTTFNKIKNTRYAIGSLVVTTGTAPTLSGIATAGFTGTLVWFRDPKITAQLGGQSDLPTTVANTSLAGSTRRQYYELLP